MNIKINKYFRVKKQAKKVNGQINIRNYEKRKNDCPFD